VSFEQLSLEEIIRQYVPLDPPTGTGWCPVLCKVCNDRGHKGKRGGFKFDGDKVAYHCFNCGPEMNTVYDPIESKGMPKKMRRILADFGIPDEEWQQVLFTNMANQNGGRKSETSKEYVSAEPAVIELPNHFYRLTNDENDKWAIIARDYLTFSRGIDPDSYPFYLSTGGDKPETKDWKGRVIIPVYNKDNQLIYYQGRDLTGKKKLKYKSPANPKDKVLYGFDKLTFSDEPLYVVEGWFDAYPINGVAILGNEISDFHIRHLNRSSRRKVYVPDRFGDGARAAIRALESGFSISTPDIGNCKDINEAVRKYGLLYVIKSLVDNTADGFTARANLGVYCTNEKDGGKKG